MMNKPLKDWTLGKMKEYCSHTNCCDECPFMGEGCMEVPSEWGLSEPPHWTAEDIADAKMVKRVLPQAVRVGKSIHGSMYIYDGYGTHGKTINAALFPDLRMGETVDLQEILDAEGKENGQTDV